MAALDPIIEPLLSGLLISPLAEYGRAASALVDQDELSGEGGIEFARDPTISLRRARAQRQLKLIHTVVEDALTRELQLTARLAELAQQVGVKSISVLPPAVQEGTRLSGRVDRLLRRDRAEAIQAFLDMWREVVGETRQRIEREIDG